MAEALAKQNKCKKVLKKIIATTLEEAQVYLNEDVNNTNEAIEIWLSYQDTWKRQINAVETLEEEILKLEYDPATIGAILTENRKFEIQSKRKLNLITTLIATMTTKKETYVYTRPK